MTAFHPERAAGKTPTTIDLKQSYGRKHARLQQSCGDQRARLQHLAGTSAHDMFDNALQDKTSYSVCKNRKPCFRVCNKLN